MADVGAMVADLIAAGCAPDVAARVVAQAFVAGVSSADVRGHSADISAERRREKDRLRKQTKRAIPQNSADVRGNPQNSESASNTTSIINSLSLDRERERKQGVRGHRLPDDWAPNPDDWREAATKLGDQGSAFELAKFRDYWKAVPGSKGLKLDWNGTFRNWIRNAKVPNDGRRKSVHDAARDLHEETLRRLAAFDEPAPRGLLDGEGSDVVRLLPPGRRQ